MSENLASGLGGLTGMEPPADRETDEDYSTHNVATVRTVKLGRQGENQTQTVRIDCTAWMTALPGCTLVVAAVRPGEKEAYLPTISVSSGVISWTVKAQDTANPGWGSAEVRAMVNGRIKKSATFRTQVEPSLTGDGSYVPVTPPDWVQIVLDGMEAEKTAGQKAEEAAASAAAAQAAVGPLASQVNTFQGKLNKLNAEAAASADGIDELKEIVLGDKSESVIYDQLSIEPVYGAYLQSGAFFDQTSSYRHVIVECSDKDVFMLYAFAIATIDGAVFFNGTPSPETKIGSLSPTPYADAVKLDNVIVELPAGCTHVVFNTYWGLSHTFIVKKRRVLASYADNGLRRRVGEHETEIAEASEKLEAIGGMMWRVSPNLYNPALQTEETISPHYYVNGAPYTTTQFDESYNATALIEVKENTTYSLAIVPAINGRTKPWGAASSGLFCYDSNGRFIEGSGASGNTFTTPAGAKYIRFNYSKVDGIKLERLNAACVLVEGSVVPTTYVPYFNETIIDRIERLEAVSYQPPINYIVEANGLGVTLISKYDAGHDIAINLKCKGGNDLFDFNTVGMIANTSPVVSTATAGMNYIIASSGDWHAPFIMSAKANANGDDVGSTNFTGGNHQYNNQGSGSTKTARCANVKFTADGMQAAGTGSCARFVMTWTNYVQAYNTRRADGSGREVLREDHRLEYDGVKFVSYVDLKPLEAVNIYTWYGFQWFTNPYKYARYVGGANRGTYDTTAKHSDCGNNHCAHVIGTGGGHALTVDVDTSYDLGDFSMLFNSLQSVFTESYGKGYFYVISNKDFEPGGVYSLKGVYTFRPDV